MSRFVHTADWQIGMTRHYLDHDAQSRYTAARLDAIRTIGALAEERSCDFVLVCGDVFESNQISRQVVARALEALGAHHTPVYLIPGNHDPLNAGSVYQSPAFVRRKPENVHVLMDSDPIEVSPGVQLVGAPWTSKRPLTDLVAKALGPLVPSANVLSIVAGHGGVDRMSPNRDNPSLIGISAIEDAIRVGKAHYIALGDRHSVTCVGDTDRIYYSGTPEPTDFNESDPGRVLIVDLGARGCRVEAIKVGTWDFRQEQFEVSGSRELDLFESWLNEQPNKDRAIVRVALKGTLNIADKARLDLVMEHASDLFASIELWQQQSHLVVRPDGNDFSELGLTGFAAAAVDELRALASGDGERGQIARDSLALLYRLMKGAS